MSLLNRLKSSRFTQAIKYKNEAAAGRFTEVSEMIEIRSFLCTYMYIYWCVEEG